jgi:hypothetical protein
MPDKKKLDKRISETLIKVLFERFCPIVIKSAKGDSDGESPDRDKTGNPGNCEGIKRRKKVDIVDFMLALTFMSRIDKDKKIKSKSLISLTFFSHVPIVRPRRRWVHGAIRHPTDASEA